MASNNNRDPRGQPPRRWSLGRQFWPILLVALLVWSWFAFRPTPPTLALSYSTFLEQVRQGNVARVEITDQDVAGQFEAPIAVLPGSTVSGGSPLLGQPESFERFTTTLPPFADDRLLPLLEEQGVEQTVRVESGSILFSLLFSLLPVVLLIGAFIWLTRQQTRGQQGVFNFGRSRAREHSLERPTVTFQDVAGADEAKRELVEVVDFLKNPDRFKALGARIPRGVLLVGPPGTGKTLLARAVAGEAGVPFFSTSASEFVELFVGVGASRVRDLFDTARRNAPAIVFIDELDAIGRQRGAGLGGGNDEREQTLNQILVEMDGFEGSQGVIIVAATNRPDVLDPALLRPGRFDRQVTVGLPDVRGREAILKIHLRGKPLGQDVEPSTLARLTPGFAGADLANLINEAALHAARKHSPRIMMQHCLEALDKIVLGLERPLLLTQHDRMVVAYHEAGHALVASLVPESDPVSKVTIIPRGRALGVTAQMPEGDRFNYSRQFLLSRLAILMGGRAAEQLVIGEITTGAENDLEQATRLSRRMIGRWGMSPELGLLSVSDTVDSPFLGREMAAPRDYSEATAAQVDHTVRELLDERMRTALQILEQNRGALDRIAAALLEYETIDYNGLMAAIRGDDIPPPTAPTGDRPLPTPPPERTELLPRSVPDVKPA